MKNTLSLSAILLFLFSAPFGANVAAQTVTLESHSTGYNWLIGFEAAPAPVGSGEVLYVFQKDGLIRLCLPDGTIEPTPFLDLSAQVNNSFNNEQGLLGLAFHPDYEANGLFFVFYNETGTGGCTVSRFSRSENNPAVADPGSETVLLTWPHPLANHVGGCMQFGPDGYLYIASGDGGSAGDPDGNGQNLNTYLGKLLRIDVGNGDEYAVPPDNPLVGTPGALPEIFAYGLRNPWRFSFDRVTGDLWIGDVGQNEREEINFIAAGDTGGHNFGWSCREGTLPFNADECTPGAELTDPIYEYENSLSSGNCSVTGGVVYRGSRYADLFGKYLFTDFCSGRIWALTPNGGGAEPVVEMGNFNDNDFTGLNAAPNGEIFLTGFFSNEIFRLKSADCTPVAWIPGPATVSLGGGAAALEAYRTDDGFGYQWMKDGEELPGATSFTLNTSEPGDYTVIVTEFGGSCTNTSNTVTVTETPTVSLSGQLEVCVASSHHYQANAPLGEGYEWAVSGGTLLDGQGTDSAFVLWGSAGVGHLELAIDYPNGSLASGEIWPEILENDLSLEADFSEAICPGENNGAIDLTVNGTGNTFEFFWNTNEVTEDIANLSAGAYKVTATSDLGCQVSGAFLLYDVPTPTYNINISPENCLGPGSIYIGASSPPCGAWEVSAFPEVSAGPWSITSLDCFGCLHTVDVEVPYEVNTIEVIGVQLVNPVGGQSNGSISLEFAGGTAPYSVMWSNGSTDNPLTDIAAGTYTATITDAEGCTLEYSAILNEVILNAGEEFSLAQNISAFPNPTAGAFVLEFDLPQRGWPKAKKMSVELLDVNGKRLLILMEEKKMTAGKKQMGFDLSGFPVGVYFVEIKIGETVFAERVVKE